MVCEFGELSGTWDYTVKYGLQSKEAIFLLSQIILLGGVMLI